MSEPFADRNNREPGTWWTSEQFQSWLSAQRRCNELMVYCELVRAPVIIAWPTSRLGLRIRPDKLVDWLRARNLAWLCFCQEDASWLYGDMSCQIGDDIDGADIGAYCHFSPSRCGFAMNLTRLYSDANYESDYEHLDAGEEYPYKGFLQAFEEEGDSEGGEGDSDSDLAASDEEGGDVDFPIRGYFEGYGGMLSPDKPQPRATFFTHDFQRLLNDERRCIRAEKARKITELHSRPGRLLRVDEVERAGITFEDLHDESLLDSDSD
ncbi:hypothetical protein BKA70DRAFT_1234889 [Coprinopsis sp. MPI-PUGE-AT-0042]|nr:hypothetical protein BKA70DRAFT_1234889 [Coprinopsis sp. MPI-PUGE-AT-0042]